MKRSLVSSRGRVRLVPVECLIIRVLLRADQVINSELISAYGPEPTCRDVRYESVIGDGTDVTQMSDFGRPQSHLSLIVLTCREARLVLVAGMAP